MSAHHCPRVLVSRQGCWTECRCGWLSSVFTTGHGASYAWALHVAACR